MVHRPHIRIVVALWFCSLCSAAIAGGGPEGILLIVNPQSSSSLTIANHYAKLRQIPSHNILYVPWKPSLATTDIDTFRQRLLVPILKAMDARRLLSQIDCIVYSTDFPWGISLDSDFRKFAQEMAKTASGEKTEWPKEITPVGSLTGLTCLFQSVVGQDNFYLHPRSNHYAHVPVGPMSAPRTEAFRGNRQYGDYGQAVTKGGRRYFMSMMLGVTAGRGNSADEILAALRRSAAADGTNPKGTIYFLRNSDIRSQVRHDLFPLAVEQLEKLGVDARIIDGTVPLNKPDVQGLMMGTSDFNWKASGSTILPGAICEHFTSFGGVMTQPYSQTPLSEFIRYGAAATSGTVTEPYSVPQKFPSPMIQVHYARGCSAAEAFYLSVAAPYQLLIVGDPLCQPWAKTPKVTVTGVEPNAVVRGTLTIEPSATLSNGEYVSSFELHVDGLRMKETKPGGRMALDTTTLSDGYHELRVVAIGPRPIESQGRRIIPIRIANGERKIEAMVDTKGRLRNDATIAISASAPGSMAIIVLQGGRVVGRVTGDKGQIVIPADTLGSGPVQLSVAGLGQGGAPSHVMAEPLELTLE